jgi:hypothetical protein
MRGTLGSLYCRRNLGVRGREQPDDLLGQRRIGGQAGQLALPKIEIPPGQAIEFGGRVFGVRGHGATIAHRRYNASFACANPVLSHCGIGAKVNRSSERAFSSERSVAEVQ